MSGAIRLNGATSGYVELVAPAVAGATQVTLPAGFQPSGLVPIETRTFTAVSSVSFDDVFTSDYDNYRVIIRATQSATANTYYRLRAASTDESGTSYVWQQVVAGSTSTTAARSTGQTGIRLFDGGADEFITSMDVFGPAVAAVTRSQSVGSGKTSLMVLANYSGYESTATAYDGFTVLPSAGTITGTATVYGYSTAVTTPVQAPSTGDPGGLALVASSTFSAASTVSVDGCFTSAYDNYRVVFAPTAYSAASATTAMRMRVAGVDNSSANYGYGIVQGTTSGGSAGVAGSLTDTSWPFLSTSHATANRNAFTCDVYRPYVSTYTAITMNGWQQDGTIGASRIGAGGLTVTTAYDGFTIYPSSGTFTGSLYVYGYSLT